MSGCGFESCADEVEALVDGGAGVADGESCFAEGGDVGDSGLKAALSAGGIDADPAKWGEWLDGFDCFDVFVEGDACFDVFVGDPECVVLVE